MLRVRQTYLLAIHWILNGFVGIEVNLSGKYAADWKKKISIQSDPALLKIDIEASSTFSQKLLKLMIIKVATRAIEAISRKETGSLGSIVI